jgi:hypothetical protein
MLFSRPTLHIRGGLLGQCKKATPNQDTTHKLRTLVFDDAFTGTINHNQTLLKKNAALAVPCMWLLEGPLMPRPTSIFKHHSDAKEARCRHHRQGYDQHSTNFSGPIPGNNTNGMVPRR